MSIVLEELTEEQRKRLSEALDFQRESDDLKDRFCTTVFQAETVFVAIVLPLTLKESAESTQGSLFLWSGIASLLSMTCGGYWLSARSRMLHRLARRTLERGREGKANGATVETSGTFDGLCFHIFLLGALVSVAILLLSLILRIVK